MARWLSPDWSAKEEPVPYSKLGDPQTLNLYSYVQNNPLSKSDSDGHETIKPGDGWNPKQDPKGGNWDMSPRAQQAVKGGLELGAVAMAGPEIAAGAAAAETLSAGFAVGASALAATGTFVNGTTHLMGAATNTNVEEATNMVTAVTNPVAGTVALATKSAETGSQAADLVTAGGTAQSVVSGKGLKNPADAASSLGGAIDAVKSAATKVRSYFTSPGPPPAPHAPGGPSCSVAGACPQ